MKIWSDGWITIHSHGATTGAGHGTHVYVGPGGEITKGPKALEGKPIDNLEEPVVYGGNPTLRLGHKNIGSFVNHHLAEGKLSPSEIVSATNAAFGGKTSASSVAWYKTQAKKTLKGPVTPEPPKGPEPIQPKGPEPVKTTSSLDPTGEISSALKPDHKVNPDYGKTFAGGSEHAQGVHDDNTKAIQDYLSGELKPMAEYTAPSGWRAVMLPRSKFESGQKHVLLFKPGEAKPVLTSAVPTSNWIGQTSPEHKADLEKAGLESGTYSEREAAWNKLSLEEMAGHHIRSKAESGMDDPTFQSYQEKIYSPETLEARIVKRHKEQQDVMKAKRAKKAAEKKAKLEAIKNPVNNPVTPLERYAAIRSGLTGKGTTKSSEKILGASLDRVASAAEAAGLDHRLFTLRPVHSISDMQPELFTRVGFSGIASGFYNPDTAAIRAVGNTERSAGTITHEYGHHIDYTFLGIYSKGKVHVTVPNDKLRKELVSDIKSEHQEELDRLQAKARNDPSIGSVADIQMLANRYGTNGVRAYACANAGEWFAESFKVYTLGGSEKTRLKSKCPKTYVAIERIAKGELFQ